MAKRIVICSDGTGNTSIKGRGTNVFKLFEAVDLTSHRFDPSVTPQVALYDDGVGTESFKPLKIFAGATGFGLSRNVRQLYKELVRIYDPDNEIYVFGFSRGAFTCTHARRAHWPVRTCRPGEVASADGQAARFRGQEGLSCVPVVFPHEARGAVPWKAER